MADLEAYKPYSNRKLPDGQVAVYRAYGPDGGLIYVGITDHPNRRINRNHRNYSRWYQEAARFDVRVFPDRPTALRVEAMAIIRESPSWMPQYDERSVDPEFVEPEPIASFGITIDRGSVFD